MEKTRKIQNPQTYPMVAQIESPLKAMPKIMFLFWFTSLNLIFMVKTCENGLIISNWVRERKNF